MSLKNYLKERRETNQAIYEFLNSEITTEADMLRGQKINLLPSNDSSDDNNIADRNDLVEENSKHWY